MIKHMLIGGLLVWALMFGPALAADLVRIMKYTRASDGHAASIWVGAKSGVLQLRRGDTVVCEDTFSSIDIDAWKAYGFYRQVDE